MPHRLLPGRGKTGDKICESFQKKWQQATRRPKTGARDQHYKTLC